jgi:hypothetical protein
MTSVDALVAEATAAAFFGAGRGAKFEPVADGLIGELFTSTQHENAEHRLLNDIALLLAYYRAGFAGSRDFGSALEAAPGETWTKCSQEAADLIGTLIEGKYPKLLPEALEQLRQQQKRLPFHLLPELLDLGVKRKELRWLILAIIGERGRWLALINPAWSVVYQLIDHFTVDDSTDLSVLQEEWNRATSTERLELLAEIRRQAPKIASSIVNGSWSQESAGAREAMLKRYITNLSVDDEAFLEMALSDRSVGVRRTAVDLLSRIPSSRFVAEAAAIAMTRLNINSGPFLAGRKLSVETPADYDPAWAKFGIEKESFIAELGTGAWCLAQLIALVPPEIWSEKFNLSAADLFDLAMKSPWSDPLIIGWSKAAERSDSNEWKYSALKHWIVNKDYRTTIADFMPTINSLGDKSEGLILEILQIFPGILDDDNPATALISSYDRPWSDRFARAVMDRVLRTIHLPQNGQAHLWLLQSLLPELAYRISPSIADELRCKLTLPQDAPTNWRKPIDNFLDIITLRDRLQKELTR